MDPKNDLHRHLRDAREAVLWKLDGLSEYDVRRPLTPSGTNLLGLVKHLTTVELLYFGFVFDRPFPEPPVWFRQDADPNEDLYALPSESREYIVTLYRQACAHSDETIRALPDDAVGYVPWWPEDLAKAPVLRVLAHVVAECQRHTGHADIARELVDGSTGLQPGNTFLPPVDRVWWTEYHQTVEEAANHFR